MFNPAFPGSINNVFPQVIMSGWFARTMKRVEIPRIAASRDCMSAKLRATDLVAPFHAFLMNVSDHDIAWEISSGDSLKQVPMEPNQIFFNPEIIH